MDRSYKFWDRMSRRYSQHPLADERAYLRKLQAMRAELDPYLDVLEFGCGTGATALILAPHARHYRAVDFSPRMIEIAQEKAARSHIESLSFECAAFEALELADDSVDVVIGMSVLHLQRDWRDVIARVYRALRPGGVFFSSTACIGDFMPALRYVAPAGRMLGALPRLNVFRRAELTQCIVDTGFIIEQQWQPAEKQGVFIAAAKAEQGRG